MNSLEYLKEEMRTKLDHIVSIKQLQHVYKKHVNISTEDLRNRILYENKSNLGRPLHSRRSAWHGLK